MLKPILIIWLLFSGSQLGEAKKESLGVYPVQQHAQYEQVIDRLKAFVTRKGKQRRNHFYLSDVTKERVTNVLGDTTINDYTYAYWEENDAIIILSFPLADHDWLERKAYIDLRRQVVPDGKYANLGCCLVEEDWARRIVHNCKTGKRLVLQKTT